MIRVCISINFQQLISDKSLLGFKNCFMHLQLSYYRSLMYIYRQKLNPTYYLDADLSWSPGWAVISTIQV